eukprot:COSAG06_NODE_20882_length_777_cov_59.306785_2_plen_89_part_00
MIDAYVYIYILILYTYIIYYILIYYIIYLYTSMMYTLYMYMHSAALMIVIMITAASSGVSSGCSASSVHDGYISRAMPAPCCCRMCSH